MGNSKIESLLTSYDIVVTADQSPTLRLKDREMGETMHHPGGAFSETLAIYGRPLSLALKTMEINPLHIMSVGLGLGYNEFLVACLSLRFNKEIKLVSYEADERLIKSYLAFIGGVDSKPEINEVYENLLGLFAKHFQVSGQAIKNQLKELLEKQSFIIHGALGLECQGDFKFHVILYDAFSSKTSPDLWQENFLTWFMNEFAAENCLFSTYACTGKLKRSLKAKNFSVIIRDGFHGKRNSTLGYRGINLSEHEYLETLRHSPAHDF